ncbi:MAG: RNA methyltransferase [Muribaculaceae bacterium]|nr:RNA methyltransferase [Muribaculaceae bacterium]
MAEKLSKTRKQALSHLSSKKMREKSGLFLIEGRKSVMDILADCESVWIPDYIVANPECSALVSRCLNERGVSDIPVFEASSIDLRDISSLSSPPEMIAVCRLPERTDENDILASPLSSGLYLLLDGIQDPGNLGTIIRTAHWFGISRIFASKDTVDLFNPKVVQSTMGSMAKVAVDYMDLQKLVDVNPHIPLVGLLLEGEDIYNTSLPQSAFIAMGNEGNGLSENLRKRVTLPLTIPPFDPGNHSESLNVSIATAITLSEFRR